MGGAGAASLLLGESIWHSFKAMLDFEGLGSEDMLIAQDGMITV